MLGLWRTRCLEHIENLVYLAACTKCNLPRLRVFIWYFQQVLAPWFVIMFFPLAGRTHCWQTNLQSAAWLLWYVADLADLSPAFNERTFCQSKETWTYAGFVSFVSLSHKHDAYGTHSESLLRHFSRTAKSTWPNWHFASCPGPEFCITLQCWNWLTSRCL